MSETQIQWSGPLAEYFRRMCSCHSHTPCAVPHGALNRLAELEAVHPEPAQAQVSDQATLHAVAEAIRASADPDGPTCAQDWYEEARVALEAARLSAPLPDGRS